MPIRLKSDRIFIVGLATKQNILPYGKTCVPVLEKEESSVMKIDGLLISLNACKIHSVKIEKHPSLGDSRAKRESEFPRY